MTHMQQRPYERALATEPAADGRPAEVVVLTNHNGMRISIADTGGTWLSCELPLADGMRDVVCGVADSAGFARQTAYFGATVGRFANRIAGGGFTLNGQFYPLACNEGTTCLHGGTDNFSHRRWQIRRRSADSVTFSLQSPDGDQGFPGNLSAEVTYQLTPENEVRLTYRTQTDKACPVSLTNHAYFNLAGENSGVKVTEGEMQIRADKRLGLNADNLPDGTLCPVAGTVFDLRTRRPLSQGFMSEAAQQLTKGFDHAFVPDPALCDGKQIIAAYWSPAGDVCLEVATTMPCIQLYTGNYLGGQPGKHGDYQDYAGLALETQYFPDGPNHPHWPDAVKGISAAGEQRESVTVYRFVF